jgi:hypothetical protein
MKKKLYLHVGSHKTATTFLQNSFANNPAVLAKLGILYPRSGQIYQAHFKLSGDLRDESQKRTPLESLPHWAALFEEVEASPLLIVLLSSEEFGWGTDPGRLSALAERFDVSVIFYMRSPDSHLESFYNQFVKDFQTRETRTLDSYVVEEALGFLDTMRLLRPWSDLFGARAVKLRIFSEAALQDGILADMLKVMGVTVVPEFRAPDVSILHKVSLAPDALDYLRLSNTWLTLQEGHHDFVVKLVQMTQKNKDALQETKAGILSLKARQNIRSRFRAANLQAVQIFMGMDKVPFPPAEAPAPPADFDLRKPEADARVMGRVAAMIRNMQ